MTDGPEPLAAPPDPELLRALVDALPFPVGLEDAQGHDLYANPALRQLRAANPGTGEPHPQGNGTAPQRFRWAHPDLPAPLWLEHRRLPLSGITAFAAVYQDIHEWHTLVQTNLLVESLLRAALTMGRMGYFLLDPAQPDLARDTNLQDLFALDPPSLLDIQALLLAQRPGEAFEFETQTAPPARPRRLRFRGERKVANADTGEERILGIVTDVTEEHHAHHLARERAVITAKSRMAAYISHEINNPLGGIKNAAILLRRLAPLTDQSLRYMDLVDEGVARIQSVVQILSAIHRPLDPAERVSLATLVGEIEHLIQRRLTHSQVALEVACPASLALGDVHADLLRQILFNLLLNAIEASPQGGVVRVRGLALPEGLRVEISDDGPGIPGHLREAIWEPGFSTQRTTISGGLTLGLALCRDLARSLGGDVGYTPAQGGRPGHFYCEISSPPRDVPKVLHPA